MEFQKWNPYLISSKEIWIKMAEYTVFMIVVVIICFICCCGNFYFGCLGFGKGGIKKNRFVMGKPANLSQRMKYLSRTQKRTTK